MRFEALTAASNIAEDTSLLEYDSASLGEQFMMIQGIVVLSKYGELLAKQHSGVFQKSCIFSVKGMSCVVSGPSLGRERIMDVVSGMDWVQTFWNKMGS